MDTIGDILSKLTSQFVVSCFSDHLWPIGFAPPAAPLSADGVKTNLLPVVRNTPIYPSPKAAKVEDNQMAKVIIVECVRESEISGAFALVDPDLDNALEEAFPAAVWVKDIQAWYLGKEHYEQLCLWADAFESTASAEASSAD